MLNHECIHLMGERGDEGYPQHKELRKNISKWWTEKPDIDYVWNRAVDFVNNDNQDS